MILSTTLAVKSKPITADHTVNLKPCIQGDMAQPSSLSNPTYFSTRCGARARRQRAALYKRLPIAIGDPGDCGSSAPHKLGKQDLPSA